MYFSSWTSHNYLNCRKKSFLYCSINSACSTVIISSCSWTSSMLPSPLSWSLLLSSPALSPFAALFFVAVFLCLPRCSLYLHWNWHPSRLQWPRLLLSWRLASGFQETCFWCFQSTSRFRACILSTWLREGWQPVPYSDQTPQWHHYFYRKKKCLQWFCRCWLPFFWFFWSLPWFFLPSPACCWFSNLLGKWICTTVVLLKKKEAWLSVSSHSVVSSLGQRIHHKRCNWLSITLQLHTTLSVSFWNGLYHWML